MNEYEIRSIDCTWSKCKNLQKINTIEIWYYVDTNDNFVIEYNFHTIDFKIWKKILDIHKEDLESCLYDLENNIIDETNLENIAQYYTFRLKSKDFNLYRNINLIFYLKKEKWNNMHEMVRKNTWDGKI